MKERKKKVLETQFQGKLIKELKERFPGAIVMKTNPGYIQGIPDLMIVYGKNWAALECKRSAKEHHQPNQDYYISKMNAMSYARFVYPENKEEVLNEIQRSFGA
jgi:hypothetical protein